MPGTSNLCLVDSNGNSGPPEGFITTAKRGDSVIWELATNSGIDALTGIRAKSGRFSVFNNSDPKSRQDGSWAGKIKDDATGSDAYDIDYQIKGQQFSADPEIKVPPPN